MPSDRYASLGSKVYPFHYRFLTLFDEVFTESAGKAVF